MNNMFVLTPPGKTAWTLFMKKLFDENVSLIILKFTDALFWFIVRIILENWIGIAVFDDFTKLEYFSEIIRKS